MIPRQLLEVAVEAEARYRRALHTLAPTSPAHRRLLAGAPRVLAALERAERLADLMPGAPAHVTPGRSRRDPSRRLTGRQRHSVRDRHLHNLGLTLLKLERAADAAVAVAVAAAPAHGDVDSAADDELAALSAALDELR
ncbi:hypothetical protein KZZ52_39670 [Dactylosporangium sp. AC04546]|uniref:hypothetical protein n=1 Tax=Dactylosporangium sp. AC04546 TaxID=2862460 RepID=UPI001EDF88D4|nr:hypothetical protein [Dactylosporangium sp. AC04546]WVK80068.1 hypothetical protein KZZ52_39670 [Dactylosporangium sp. AC04546]